MRKTSTLGCTFITYNEEERLDQSLKSAKQWCRHIVVIDKGSTDSTVETAIRHGARVMEIEFSDRGEEDRMRIQGALTDIEPRFPEWYLALTAGDIATLDLIKEIEDAISLKGSSFEVGLLKTRYYSFGDYYEKNPWKTIGTPRLFNRERARLIQTHHDYASHGNRTQEIGDEHKAFVLHQTHAGVDSFLRMHILYAEHEGTRNLGTSWTSLAKSTGRLLLSLTDRKVSRLQVLGMIVYRLMKIMFSIEASQGRDIGLEYKSRRELYIRENR